MEDGLGPTRRVETPRPILSPGGNEGIGLTGGQDVQQPSESFTEPLTMIQGNAGVPVGTAPPPPTSLHLRCRMCNAPPTVATRPTVTTCGHLFCSE